MTTVNVDSANTTAIEYDSSGSSPWTLTQTANNGAIFGQTLTRVQGTAGAVFRFHGTSVQVYGSVAVPTVSGATAVSLYALDGGNTTTFSTSSVPNSRVNEIDGQLFFDSGTLLDDSHVLVINVTTASEGAPYLLDYIQAVETNPSVSTTTATSSTGSPTALPSGGSSKSNVAPIVGGVVGGVVGLLLLVVAVFFHSRHRKHRVKLEQGGKDLVEDLADEPKPDTDSSAPFTTGDSVWRPASPSRPTSNAPYAESTLAPSDSASQVAGRLYAAELAAQRRAGQSTGPGPSATAQANPVASHSRSSAAPTPGSRFNLPTGAAAWRSDRKEAREAAVPLPVPEVPEEEAVQHQDSGIRFRDGELLPPASALALAQAQTQEQEHPSGVTSPHGGEDELDQPPEYEDTRS